MFRLLLTFFALTNVACAVEGAIQTRTVPATRDGQQARVNLQVERTPLSFPSGKAGQVDLVMLYDPESRLFWWQYRTIDPGQPPAAGDEPLAGSVVYVTGDKLVVFNFSVPFVWVRESSERYPSLAEGRAGAQAALRKMSGQIERGGDELFRTINVGKAVGSDFLHLAGDASSSPEPKLREVSRKDGRWHLILDGPNKDSAEVVLSDDYQLVEARRLPGKQ